MYSTSNLISWTWHASLYWRDHKSHKANVYLSEKLLEKTHNLEKFTRHVDLYQSKDWQIFQTILEQERIPKNLKDASIVHLYKRTGNRQSCDNHRGISLLSVSGKIIARIILNRLLSHLEDGILPESQCGFRAGRGTVDMIFATKQLQKKCQEQNIDLYTTFVDFTKAFDTVSRTWLWKIMGKFDCSSRFISMVRQFHDGLKAYVVDEGDHSAPFEVTNSVKKGCVLAPTLFTL